MDTTDRDQLPVALYLQRSPESVRGGGAITCNLAPDAVYYSSSAAPTLSVLCVNPHHSISRPDAETDSFFFGRNAGGTRQTCVFGGHTSRAVLLRRAERGESSPRFLNPP